MRYYFFPIRLAYIKNHNKAPLAKLCEIGHFIIAGGSAIDVALRRTIWQ